MGKTLQKREKHRPERGQDMHVQVAVQVQAGSGNRSLNAGRLGRAFFRDLVQQGLF